MRSLPRLAWASPTISLPALGFRVSLARNAAAVAVAVLAGLIPGSVLGNAPTPDLALPMVTTTAVVYAAGPVAGGLAALATGLVLDSVAPEGRLGPAATQFVALALLLAAARSAIRRPWIAALASGAVGATFLLAHAAATSRGAIPDPGVLVTIGLAGVVAALVALLMHRRHQGETGTDVTP